MTGLVELDLFERAALNIGLDDLQDEMCIEPFPSGDGWSLRIDGSHELIYLRKSDGWTSDQVACIGRILEKLEDLLYGRVKNMIDAMESAGPETPAGAQP
jgi:hypothetical protein